MTVRLEGGYQSVDGLAPDLLPVRHAEQVDDAGALAVVDDGYLHATSLTGLYQGVCSPTVGLRPVASGEASR